MTQKEIDKFLGNTKVYVNGKSKEIQEKLFALGYYWYDEENKGIVHNTNAPFLFFHKNKEITFSKDMGHFKRKEYKEITAEQILSLEEPSYRPFKDVEECWQEMLKHQPFGWLKSKKNGRYRCIGEVSYSDEFETVYIALSTSESLSRCSGAVFDEYTFADGAPFGIKEI